MKVVLLMWTGVIIETSICRSRLLLELLNVQVPKTTDLITVLMRKQFLVKNEKNATQIRVSSLETHQKPAKPIRTQTWWNCAKTDKNQAEPIRCNWSLHYSLPCCAIILIIFWDFLMFYQILFSPHVKLCTIITYNHSINE